MENKLELIDSEIAYLQDKIFSIESQIESLELDRERTVYKKCREAEKNFDKDDDSEIIILKSPSSAEYCKPCKKYCHEVYRIAEHTFKIKRNKWIHIGKILNSNKQFYNSCKMDFFKVDAFEGNHKCPFEVKLVDMYNDTIEIPKKKIKNSYGYFKLINVLREYIDIANPSWMPYKSFQ